MKIKPKFKIGQKVWYIADGFIATGIIFAVMNYSDTILYSLDDAEFTYSNNPGESTYSYKRDSCKWQDDLYPNKEALIKNIKEQED